MSTRRVLLGYVVRAHGVRGALRVRPASGHAAETIRSLREVPVVYLDDQPRSLTRVRMDKDDLLVEIEGLTDRDIAEGLRGRPLSVERAHLPPPNEGELYLDDLVGCEVVAPNGASIGRVRGCFHSGAHETLIVDAGAGERLLPYVLSHVVAVDLDARRIVYDAPEGLLDEEG